jgi:protein-disulfide isomerase
MAALVARHPDRLRYVWRHLPLEEVHPYARRAAEAAEAAAAQNGFWAMHDRLITADDPDDAALIDLA